MKYFLFLLLLACSTPKPPVQPQKDIVISEHAPNKETALMKQNIIHLTQVYDLDPFMFSTHVHIDPKASAKLSPDLTLGTRYAHQPERALSALLYGEFLWWLQARPVEVKAATKELKKSFPGLKESSYIQLISCYLEFEGLKKVLGPKHAQRVTKAVSQNDRVRPKLYGLVLNQNQALKTIIVKNNLLPSSLL